MAVKQAQVMNFLNENYIHNITLVESIRKNNADIIYFDGECVLLFDRASDMMMISSHSMESVTKAINLVKKPYDFLVIQDAYSELILKHFQLKRCAEYYQAVYTHDVIQTETNHRLNIKVLDFADLDIAKKYFNTYNSVYLEDRVANQKLWVAYDDEAVAGFVGIHDEGSIGLLLVTPDYRGKGYGKVLLTFMTNYFLKNKQTPYSQIAIDNVKSIQLHQSLGYTLSSEKVVWLRNLSNTTTAY